MHFKLADGVVVHAHKAVLASRCPHWRARLQQEPALATVEAKEHKREVLLAALEFVYTGDAKVRPISTCLCSLCVCVCAS